MPLIQLHSGSRSVSALTGTDPVGPSAHAKSGARALTESEIEQVIADFITAAERAERAAFDDVEIHGGPGYLLGSFRSPVMNQRSDVYGGSLDNRPAFGARSSPGYASTGQVGVGIFISHGDIVFFQKLHIHPFSALVIRRERERERERGNF